MKNKFILGIVISICITVLLLGLSSAKTEYYEVGIVTDLQLSCSINGAIPSGSTIMNLTVNYPNGSTFLNNVATTAKGNGIFNYTTIFPIIGTYNPILLCIDGGNSSSDSDGIYEITPTGKVVSDIGQISTGILYFLLILGFGFVFLGYLFLKHESVWVMYSGLFLMLIGFAFLYYDLHLSNLYATTIAVNSGAEHVTTGAFVMIARFLKLAPYLVAGIVLFYTVRTLRMTIKVKKSKDGWDNNSY